MIGFLPAAVIAAPALYILSVMPAQAAPALDGASLSAVWALPFAGILLTIATGPLLFPRFWHNHYGKLALAWGLATLVSVAARHGTDATLAAFSHALIGEYMSFIALLFALYVVAGGILVTGNFRGTPLTNTILIGFGTAIASIVGTTGAAMILIRPLLRANAARRYQAHVVVFFIILAANIGGALTPLGDPPLFVGYLRGVDFFWATGRLWLPTLAAAVIVLAVFAGIDTILSWREPPVAARGPLRLRVFGTVNLGLIVLIIAAILAASFWRLGISFSVFGTKIAIEGLVRDALLIGIALVSLWLTPEEHRAANGFTFEPIREVAILFAAIFVCIIPVLAMLDAGRDGAFGWLIGMLTAADGKNNDIAYFWLAGILSAFLDNAPTYLVFFELAGGDAARLMTSLAPTLAAISMGAVYMGALTYIGNAPNFMIYAIATEHGVAMPGFLGYLAWSGAVLIPLFLILTPVFLP